MEKVILKIWTASLIQGYLILALSLMQFKVIIITNIINYFKLVYLFIFLLQIMSLRTFSPQNIKTAKFNEIKELQYFKKLFRDKQQLQLKQLLAQHVMKCVTRSLDHDNYIYIAQKTCNQCEAGAIIDSNIKVLSKRIIVYRVTQKLDKILRHVILIQIPVICKYKNIDRFKIYNECEVQYFSFNRTVFRKGEQMNGIFYIVNGQIKVTNDKKGNCPKIISKNNFIGLQELHEAMNEYAVTAFSNSNDTILLFINNNILKMVDKISEEQEEPRTLRQQFSLYFQQLKQLKHNIKRKNFIPLQINLRRKLNKQPIKLNYFLKKIQNFKSNTTRHDNGFNQYLKTKKVMLQLKQTMLLHKSGKYKAYNKENLYFKNNSDQINKANDMVYSSRRSQLWKSSLIKRLGANSVEQLPQPDIINFGSTIRSLVINRNQ